MVELRSVPEGYLPGNSLGPGGFGGHVPSWVKLEEGLDHFFAAYHQADSFSRIGPPLHSPPIPLCAELGSYLLHELDPYKDPLGACCGDVSCPMYDFPTPDLTPPPCGLGPVDDVLSSLSSPSSLAMATNKLSLSMEDMLLPAVFSPAHSPPDHLLSPDVTPPPPVIYPVEGECVLRDLLGAATKRSPLGQHASCSDGGVALEERNRPAKRQKRISEPRKQRKREQNKVAALKYRCRKKKEKYSQDKQICRLERENASLQDKITSAEEELSCLKMMLHEVQCVHKNSFTDK